MTTTVTEYPLLYTRAEVIALLAEAEQPATGHAKIRELEGRIERIAEMARRALEKAGDDATMVRYRDPEMLLQVRRDILSDAVRAA